MNFQAVDQANGNNVTLWATMTEHLGVTQKEGKLKLKCKLKDDNGVTHNAHIHKGTGELPDVGYLDKRMEFSLSTFQGTYQGSQYTGYSGFWSHGAVKGSQDSPQSPQNAPESPNAPQAGNNDVGIRTDLVCAYISNGTKPLIEDVEYWMKYIKTGIDASLPEGFRPVTNEDVPF